MDRLLRPRGQEGPRADPDARTARCRPRSRCPAASRKASPWVPTASLWLADDQDKCVLKHRGRAAQSCEKELAPDPASPPPRIVARVPGRLISALGYTRRHDSSTPVSWRGRSRLLCAGPAAADGPFELEKGDFRFHPTGYIQGDFRSFQDWDAGDEDTGSPAQRHRASCAGCASASRRTWRWLAVEVDVDPQDDGDELKDLYLDLRLRARRSTCAAGTSSCR